MTEMAHKSPTKDFNKFSQTAHSGFGMKNNNIGSLGGNVAHLGTDDVGFGVEGVGKSGEDT